MIMAAGPGCADHYWAGRKTGCEGVERCVEAEAPASWQRSVNCPQVESLPRLRPGPTVGPRETRPGPSLTCSTYSPGHSVPGEREQQVDTVDSRSAGAVDKNLG